MKAKSKHEAQTWVYNDAKSSEHFNKIMLNANRAYNMADGAEMEDNLVNNPDISKYEAARRFNELYYISHDINGLFSGDFNDSKYDRFVELADAREEAFSKIFEPQDSVSKVFDDYMGSALDYAAESYAKKHVFRVGNIPIETDNADSARDMYFAVRNSFAKNIEESTKTNDMEIVPKNTSKIPKTAALAAGALLILGASVALAGCVGDDDHPIDNTTDTDNDGLTDYQEMNVYHTDSFKADTDGDYVSDIVEIQKGTDPLNIYSFGQNKIGDFTRLFIYPNYLNANNSDKDAAFLDMIPNVKASSFLFVNANPVNVPTDEETAMPVIVDISVKQDPLVRYMADRTEIILPNNGSDGNFMVDGEKIYNDNWEMGTLVPSIYLTNGRVGSCAAVADTTASIAKIKGYDAHIFSARDVQGLYGGSAKGWHAWTELEIDGKDYVISFADIVPKDEFYKKYQWGEIEQIL